ncbi:MAG TPA: hypothetical protein VGB71_18825 [Flavisolibacter sp.]|jgi:hypothetical protein
MKTTTVSTIVRIEEDILQSFQPVNETLATDYFATKTPVKTKQFGVIDLWKCHKQRRYSGVRIS